MFSHLENLKIHGDELEHVFEEKDLGVVFESELKFEQHTAQKVKKANQIMGYTPHLEYAQAVWAPYLRKHVIMLENVQKRATKLVDDFKDLEYTERLRTVNLPTLIYRRARCDMIEMYKHFHAYDKNT